MRWFAVNDSKYAIEKFSIMSSVAALQHDLPELESFEFQFLGRDDRDPASYSL